MNGSQPAGRQWGERIKAMAADVGFVACGICTPEPIERADYVRDWIRAGRHGGMDYLGRNLDVRLDPRQMLAGAKSVIVVAWLYRVRETAEGQPFGLSGSEAGETAGGAGAQAPGNDESTIDEAGGAGDAQAPTIGARGQTAVGGDTAAVPGRIARYAWGRDYHRVIRNRLHRLVDRLRDQTGADFASRVCVDTAPLLERELAARAGVGWIGSNCLVLNRDFGSYFCLGAVLTTLDLPADEPAADSCGTCRRCVDACPTGALIGPRRMDARLCLSYRTIENRQAEGPAEHFGQIFGCDICQQVCPYNGPRAAVSIDADAQPRLPAGAVDAARVVEWEQADWDAATRGRALRRADLEMWRRNARALLTGQPSS